MRVFGWAADTAGCGYYRVARPFWALRKAYPDWAAEASQRMDIDDTANADLIVGQRVEKPDCADWWREQDPARLVFEIDDDLWNVPRESPAWEGNNEPGVLERLAENAAHAGLVTVSTEPLAERLRTMNPNVAVLPNYIDGRLLDWQRPRRGNPVVGWAGSNTHVMDFRVAAPGLRGMLGKTGWDLHLFGPDYSGMVKRTTRLTPWVDGVDTYHRLIDFDIGIAPLAPNLFNDSKSHIKALEYAALGIPIVASNVGPYPGFVQHGVTGFLVDPGDKKGWYRYLTQLAGDAGLRERMGAAAKELAAEHTIQGNIWRHRDVYEQALAVA